MRRPSRAANLRAGLVALALLGVAVYAIFSPRVPGLPQHEIRAVFPTSNELAKGSPVRVAGIDVGTVTAIERGPGEAATVTMAIRDRGLPIHADATAAIRPRIVLEGNFFVDLEPGTPGAPLLGDGGRIPLAQTSVPVQLDQVVATFDRSTRGQTQQLVREYARALSGGGAADARRALRQAPGAFGNLAVAARAARGRDDADLTTAIRDGGRLAAALARREAALRALLPAYARTSGALADTRRDLAAATGELAALVDALPGDARAVDAALPELDRAAAALRPALRVLPAVARDAHPALAQLTAVLGAPEARGLAADLRPALRALGTAQPRAGRLLSRVTPVSACVADVVLPTLGAKVPDGRLSVDQPVWQELLHLATSLASASQNFDANGPSARFHAGYGEGAVSLGDLPTIGEAFATQSFTGSRPRWLGPGKEPPFRPDVACTTQRPPDLTAETLGAPAQRRVSLRPGPAQLRRMRAALHRLLATEPRP